MNPGLQPPGVEKPLPGVIYPPRQRLDAYLASGVLERTSLVAALTESFRKHASRTALISSELRISYADLDDASDRIACSLLDHGLEPCDRMLFQCGNSVELVYLFVACLKAGIIPVCTLAAHRRREIGFLGRFADAKAHAVQGHNPGFDLVAFARDMRSEMPATRLLITVGGTGARSTKARNDGEVPLADLLTHSGADFARERMTTFEHDPFQVAVFQLSGGTTGVPKIIPRFSNDYLLNVRLSARALDYTPEDVIFNPMPMIHNACMVVFWLPALLSGAAFAVAEDLVPENWARLFQRAKPTVTGMIRAMLPRFDELLALHPRALEDLRMFWAPDAARLVRTRYGKTTHCMFGMTEGLNMWTLANDPAEVVDTTVGRPLVEGDEVRVVQTGTAIPCAMDEAGELQCRGPYTLHGYYNSPEHNRVAFTSDGFYRTGDVVVKREIDGQIYYAFAGRTKDVVDRGTEKISCEEIEAAVASHAGVAEVAVVGMPDSRLGERVCAYVVTKGSQPVLTVAGLGQYLEQFGLAKFKWPERIEIVRQLPRTQVGKFDKARLRQDISAKLQVEKDGGVSP